MARSRTHLTITSSQYIFKGTIFTATTTATMGAYTVASGTRFQVVALTLCNTSTTNAMAFVDVSLFDGTTAFPNLTKAPLYPGGNLIVNGLEKHVLPTSGAVYVTPYATNVSGQMSGVEIT